MKEHVTIKHKYVRDFTVLPNNLLRDNTLSWGATGLLAYLMHLPDNFQLYLSYLSKQKRDGRDATRARIKELEVVGYLKIYRERDGRGQFSNTSWELNPAPQTPEAEAFPPGSENPNLDMPKAAVPTGAKPTLLNTKQKQELKEKNTTTTKPSVDKSHKDLFYPPGLVSNEPRFLYKALLDVPLEDAQALLDELSGVMETPGALRTTPIRLLHGLLKKYKSGLFIPSAGLKISRRREQYP